MLRESLVRLQKHGLVHRPGTGDAAPYELTGAGKALLPLVLAFLDQLQQWGEQHAPPQ